MKACHTAQTIAENIRKLRKGASLTQAEVAARIFVTRRMYQKYELATCTPNIEIMNRLANLYDVSLNDLVNKNIEV
jgi:transcriptional regulator with XRE-family HTH domain